jgi:20S proteasome alpha/beta subunit
MTTMTALSSSRRPTLYIRLSLLMWACVFLGGNCVCYGSDSGIDGRHSFSLTTFDPSGKLGQVERASIAASLGIPIVAVCCRRNNGSSGILMAAPQVLSSPLVKADGTSRFSMVSSEIAVAHSGISADGRVLVAAAQRLAVEHAYTFNEPIPIELFLEEVSLLFQEYTMKPGARPFGVTLLVAYVPCSSMENDNHDGPQPHLYRIDPSGSVSSLGSYAIINGKKLINDEAVAKIKEIANTMGDDLEQAQVRLTKILTDAIRKASSISSPSPPTLVEPEGSEPSPISIPTVMKTISASLAEEQGLVIRLA